MGSGGSGFGSRRFEVPEVPIREMSQFPNSVEPEEAPPPRRRLLGDCYEFCYARGEESDEIFLVY